MNNSGIGTPYWYEWEIGIIECLKMMMDNEISTVVLQSSEFQKLDDVVVNYKDGSMANIQVKHTDIDANLTYSFLDSENDSILGGLAKEWKEKKQKYQIREIQLVTNKKWGPAKSDGKCSMRQFVTKVYPKLKEDVSYCGENKLEEAAITWFKTALKLSEDDMKAFIKVFSFREELDLEKIEQTIKQKIEQILGTKREDAVDSCLSKVLAELRIWSTSRRKKQEITKEDIYKVVCIKDTGIPVYDLYPEKPIFPSRERFAKEFISKIEKTTNKIVFLQGLPGAGKTNFISYLSQLNQSIVDFRYYTYLPVGRDQTSYSDDEGFYLGSLLWKSILVQLRTKFEKMGVLSNVEFPVAYQYLSVSEMRKYAIKFLPIYARKISRTCYIFIDGIDHAARSLNARNSFLLQLPKPEEVGNGIKIILVGQPVNDKYPSWLLKNENIDYIFMPSLETDDIIMLLDNNIRTLKVDNVSLANTIISVVGNNALNVLFAIMELKKIDGLLSFEDIERILGERCLNSQIDKYYEWIINSIERSMLFYKIQAIFACVSRKILLEDISRICDCQEDDVLLILNNLYPLLLCDGDGYYVFHNDVRLHLKNEIIVNSNYAYIVEKIKRSINCNWKLEKYKYDILYDLVLNLKDTEEILNLVTVDYIMQSVMYDISFETLSKQFLNIMNLLMYKGQYKYLPEVSTIALTLSQFAKCILYYDKKKIYVENTMTKSKTRSEKYILGFENNTEQIINDIYYLYVNDLPERAKKVFYEYIGENIGVQGVQTR